MHENETCRLEGGGIEGYPIEDCITEQRRINQEYYNNIKNANAETSNSNPQ